MWLAGMTVSIASHAMDAADLYERRSPSIWVVHVQDGQQHQIAIGSAVVTGRDELTTNCHVLRQGKVITVKREQKSLPATLKYADTARDLCVLGADGLRAPAVPVAPVTTLKVGQRVYAIGAPRGLELTLSDGLIASLHRDDSGELVQIQISAPVSPGSSGGGLFDADGRLVGVPYMSLREAQNVNFAIPANWIAEVPARSAMAIANYRAEVAQARAAKAAPTPAAAPGAPQAGKRQQSETGTSREGS